MTPAPATRRPTFTVSNPTAEPTDQWIRAVARLLLDAADRRLAEQAAIQDGGQAAAAGADQDQDQGDQDR